MWVPTLLLILILDRGGIFRPLAVLFNFKLNWKVFSTRTTIVLWKLVFSGWTRQNLKAVWQIRQANSQKQLPRIMTCYRGLNISIPMWRTFHKIELPKHDVSSLWRDHRNLHCFLTDIIAGAASVRKPSFLVKVATRSNVNLVLLLKWSHFRSVVWLAHDTNLTQVCGRVLQVLEN